jgi:hypothetical protein
MSLDDYLIIEADVLRRISLDKLNRNSKKRTVIDPRNFLINILYYRFGWTEQRIGDLLGKTASNINSCKDNAYHLREDPHFIVNTHKVRHEFPSWEAPEPKRKLSLESKRKKAITVHLTKHQVELLDIYRQKNGIRSYDVAIRKILFPNF